MSFGEPGTYFPKRKDAENFALVLAMYLNGDLPNRDLLDPIFFNGFRRRNYDPNSVLNKLFWTDVTMIDPTEGWDIFDFSELGFLPNDILNVLPKDDKSFKHIDPRTDELEMFLFELSNFIERNLFTSVLDNSIHDLMEQSIIDEENYSDCPHELRGFATLCIVNYYKNLIPFQWVFPNQQNNIAELLPRLKENLPTGISDLLKRMELEGEFLSIK